MVWTHTVAVLIYLLLGNNSYFGDGAACRYDLNDAMVGKRQCRLWTAMKWCDLKADWMGPNCAWSCGQLCGGTCPRMLNCGPVDLSIVLDSSRSVGDKGFFKARDFLLRLLSCFDFSQATTRVSVIPYGYQVYTYDAIDFDSYDNQWETLNERISRIIYMAGNRTSTGEAIAYMLDKHMPKARQGVPHFGIVFTFGQSSDLQRTRDEAKRARDKGVKMVAIGYSKHTSRTELENIAASKEAIFEFKTQKDLDNIIGDLRKSICFVANKEIPGDLDSPCETGSNCTTSGLGRAKRSGFLDILMK